MFAMARPIWAQGREKESNLILQQVTLATVRKG